MKIAVDTNFLMSEMQTFLSILKTSELVFLISATQWDYSVSNKLLQKLIRNNAEIFTTKEILEEFA